VVTKQKAETERATALLNSQNEKEGILESHDIVLSKSDLYKTIPDTIESVVDLKEEFRKGIPEQKPYGIDTRRYLSQTLLDLSYDLDAVVQKLSRDHPLMNALSENVEEIVDELHKYATDLDKNIEEVITEKDVERVYYFYEHATSLINVLGKVADDKTLLNFMKTDITSDIDLELDVVFRTEEELKEWLFTIADMLNRPDTDPEKMKWLQETLNAK
uniref:Uncharacterized protein LOC102809522 n=1 Tax=Saccoglossus kowalevskii TaxID=10224 RepID=A0ABM0MCB6_SACKO